MKLLTLIALIFFSSSVMAFDFKKLISDTVKDTAEDIIEDNVDDAADMVKDLVPSISDFKVEKSEPVPELPWVETNQNIIVYSTTRCGYCVKLKKYLVSNNIPFVDKDVDSDDDYHAEWKALGGKGVPHSLVKNDIARGFSEPNWDKLLARHGFK